MQRHAFVSYIVSLLQNAQMSHAYNIRDIQYIQSWVVTDYM